MSKWTTVTVGEIAAKVRNALVGGPFGSNLVSKDYVEEGVPVIRGQNMGSRWVAGEFAYVSLEKANSLAANTTRPGDLVFTQRGTLGQVALVPGAPFNAYVVSQSQMKLTVDQTKADPVFLYYVFSSSSQQEYIRQNAIQVGVPHTNLGILRDTPITLPSLREQRAIAQILGTLDDKIELNRSMNETLEAMARAIFKSWFVDFAPVRAKTSGEPPESICRRLGLTPDLLALFPDRFQDSELGEIPMGWEVGPLDSVLVLQRGFDLPAPDRTQGRYPVLAASGPIGTHNEFKVRGPGVTTGRSGVLGKVFYVHGDFWPLNTSLWVKYFLHARPAYAFHLLQGIDFGALNAGTAVPTLNRNHAHTIRVLKPSLTLIDTFEKIAVSLLENQHDNNNQANCLVELRDALLPKLMAGELCISATGAT